jgi:hypothetical protein
MERRDKIKAAYKIICDHIPTEVAIEKGIDRAAIAGDIVLHFQEKETA